MRLRTFRAGGLAVCFVALATVASTSCIPDVPTSLLSEPSILQHPAVVAAFAEVERNLSSLFTGNTRDGLSFAVVHASSPEKAYSFNNGTLRFNETEDDTPLVDSDSIFRVASVSKNIATFSALVVENESRQRDTQATFTLDTPVRQILPSFGLPDIDWKNGGSEITLSMLGTHSSGLPREGYVTSYNMVIGLSQANSNTIGEEWAGVTPESLIMSFKTRPLMFGPGQRPGYSNAGICLLAFATVAQHNALHNTSQTWTAFADDLLHSLSLNSSFFGAIPPPLTERIAIPGADNWVDLLIGPGYDPAGGMWSSANDLVRYLHNWLSPTPRLISSLQRRTALQPRLTLPDGKQSVGFGWEITDVSTSASLGQEKKYALVGKSGDAGGFHSWVDVVPQLGYGIVVLTSESQDAAPDYARLVPTGIRDRVHGILVPAFAEAVEASLRTRFAGRYGAMGDLGLVAEETRGNGTGTFARVEVDGGQLFIREMVVNGTNALEGLDRLGWTEESQGRFFSTEQGVGLNPAEGAGEAAEFGEGSLVWRVIPDLESCDWFDFDGYADGNGWPLSKVVTIEQGGRTELVYPPFDIRMARES
ncbi:hypothetical protein CAC42_8159 [Sphaceloma murrayae]|uniref:Beta-lactamase-related domain-containing protein n=1 Tax=Sphaceloma murrayae TaxID=2082308 RepID=A0A2K1QJ24_9PEZI|nr:hypothetical protein CAC42_8159 [Sphaceloma murrayae]